MKQISRPKTKTKQLLYKKSYRLRLFALRLEEVFEDLERLMALDLEVFMFFLDAFLHAKTNKQNNKTTSNLYLHLFVGAFCWGKGFHPIYDYAQYTHTGI